jgi:hypothetical protein
MKSAITAATTTAVKGRGMAGDLAVVWRERKEKRGPV